MLIIGVFQHKPFIINKTELCSVTLIYLQKTVSIMFKKIIYASLFGALSLATPAQAFFCAKVCKTMLHGRSSPVSPYDYQLPPGYYQPLASAASNGYQGQAFYPAQPYAYPPMMPPRKKCRTGFCPF